MTPGDTSVPEIGLELPVFEREVGFPNWNRFAAVNDEFVPIHMDDEAGRAAGYPSAFGMGNLQLAYLHALLRGWLGQRGEVTSLKVQYRRAALRGTLNRACGVVTKVDESGPRAVVSLDVWVESNDGERLTIGTATAALDGRQGD